jgi:hypothetical protein
VTSSFIVKIPILAAPKKATGSQSASCSQGAVVSRSATLNRRKHGSFIPRLVTRRQAAEYCNLSTTSFSNWVKMGRLPSPIPDTSRWDLKAINKALDVLSGFAQEEESALDVWRSKRARRSERNS